MGYSNLLLLNYKRYDQSKIESQLIKINQATTNTLNLLEDLLLWSKVQSNRLDFDIITIQLQPVCQETLSFLSLQAESKNITLHYKDTHDLSILANGDMLKTVLRNLISNAIKFTNDFGVIQVVCEKTDGFALIRVIDNGIGIEEKDINKLFDFTQQHTTIGTANEKGTGLGLVLCKELIEKLGGTIWVKSVVNQGSEFAFTLPLALQSKEN